MDKSLKIELDAYGARTGMQLTDEQAEFASDFRQPIISFSSPGTGKSQSTVAGLIIAQTVHRVPGKHINALSFTKAATAELSAKYEWACKKCDITPTVVFNTFHSICLSILREKYPSIKIKAFMDREDAVTTLGLYMEKYNLDTENKFYIRRVYDAINALNRALIYDRIAVELAYDFKVLNMPVDVFQNLRRDWFNLGLVSKEITRADIPIYALDVLLRDKRLQEIYKKKYKIMVVDEFQDMTLLNLKILSLISGNLIAIGDMKQQIYLFNGACQQIVKEYKKMYPNARELNLTQSFRCKDEIAEYATSVYYPNDRNVKAFTGVGEGGSITVLSSRDLDLKSIVAKIKESEEKQGFANARQSMFLYRNNFSATPIAEELYKQGVSFRVNKFAKVMNIPIFKEMTEYIQLAANPDNETFTRNIPKLFPEFRKYKGSECPLLIAMYKAGKGLFDVKYEFQEQSSIEIMTALKRARLAVERKKTASVVYATVLPIYEKYVIDGKWWKLEFKKEYYFSLAESIVSTKTFEQMINEEYDKERKIEECNRTNTGVRCYTMHSAKGLEADEVYILDAEDILFPAESKMKKYIQAGCEYEAAKELRNERNLIYVAISRAKENVYITYRDRLSQLVESPCENRYSYLDKIYEETNIETDDITAFLELFKLKDNSNSVVFEADMVAEPSLLKDEYAGIYDLDFV